MHPKIDIEEGNPQKLPSPGGRGLRGGDKKGDNRDCSEKTCNLLKTITNHGIF